MALVYFVSDGEYIKIGQTTNLKKRLAGLQCANARRLTVLHTIENDDINYIEELESKLHNIFGESRVVGEWFNLNWEDTYHRVLQIEDNIEKEIATREERLEALSKEWDRQALQTRFNWLVTQDIQNNYPPMKHGGAHSFSSIRFGNPRTPIIRPSFIQNLKPPVSQLIDDEDDEEPLVSRFDFRPINKDGTPRKSRFA